MSDVLIDSDRDLNLARVLATLADALNFCDRDLDGDLVSWDDVVIDSDKDTNIDEEILMNLAIEGTELLYNMNII